LQRRVARVDPGEALGAPLLAHAVHFYEDEPSMVGVVAAYLAEGIRDGEGALAIVTREHARALDRSLFSMGLDPAAQKDAGTLALLDADEAFARFMAGRAPDPGRFRAVIAAEVERVRSASRAGRVRAFGEMVEVLRRDGNVPALLHVEALWSELVDALAFSLLCAYPLRGFARREDAVAFRDVCAGHDDVVPGAAFAAMTTDAQRRHVAELERRAKMLAEEVELRRRLEAESARVHEAERAARAEVALLYRVTDAANRAETLDEVYAAALDGIAAALGAERLAILRFDAEGVMRFEAWRGLSEPYRAAVEGHSPWRPGDANPAPVLVEDALADPALAALRPALEREGIGALGFFPLARGGRLLGKFMVYYPGPHAFGEPEIRLAMGIADQVAFAVDRTLASLERERFLGIVGHDLRNPLNAISVSAGLLLRADADEAVARSARRIVTSVGRMERLITQVLDLAKARHGGGLPIHRSPCDLAEVARHAVEEIGAAHPGRAFPLAVEGDTRAELDADRMAEVFSNLLGNGVQHGGDGPVDVRVRGEAGELVAEVHNVGPPIPAAVLPALFDPFRRGPGGGDRQGSVGLGLFISREVVRAHGGRIEVRTGEAGTTFVVRLPRAGAAPVTNPRRDAAAG